MLSDQIQKDLETAMKAKQDVEVSTLRLLLSEMHNRQIALRLAQGEKITDEQVIGVVCQQAKQRQEAIEAYQKADRQELADKESKELDILSKYLPQELSGEEVEKAVKEAIGEVGATGQQDFGRVMSKVMEKLKGKVDGAKVAQAVKKLI